MTDRIVIVRDAGTGGLALSDEALDMLAETHGWTGDPGELSREDERLVDVVERLGSRAGAHVAGGPRQRLAIVEVPTDLWIIQEVDGQEWVAECHRRWDADGLVPDEDLNVPPRSGS